MSPDHGYFPPGSMLRRVQRERAVGLLYGQRALGIGAVDPRNFMGTLLHTAPLTVPFHRLVATAKMFEAIFFGTRAKADQILAAVHRMHSQVEGTLPEDAGSFPAGTPYSAHDPELMLWTIAPPPTRRSTSTSCSCESSPNRSSMSSGPTTCVSVSSSGCPRRSRRRRGDELREYVDSKIDGPDAFLTEEAQIIGRAVMLEIPTSRFPPARHAGSQPCDARLAPAAHPAALRPPLDAGRRRAFRGTVAAARAARPVTPRSVRRGSCVAQFDDVAAAERRRIVNGWTSPVEVPRAAVSDTL